MTLEKAVITGCAGDTAQYWYGQDLTRLISSCLNRLSRKGLSQAKNLTLIVMRKF